MKAADCTGGVLAAEGLFSMGSAMRTTRPDSSGSPLVSWVGAGSARPRERAALPYQNKTGDRRPPLQREAFRWNVSCNGEGAAATAAPPGRLYKGASRPTRDRGPSAPTIASPGRTLLGTTGLRRAAGVAAAGGGRAQPICNASRGRRSGGHASIRAAKLRQPPRPTSTNLPGPASDRIP